MSKLSTAELWEMVGEHYQEHYAQMSREEILAQLAQAHQDIHALEQRVNYLYGHTRKNVRDSDPLRNEQIKQWIDRGISDRHIQKYLVKGISLKIVEKIRLEMGIKKPRGRPKKS